MFYVFATQQRFPSPVQLLVNNELFHQSSFYLNNIVSSCQLLFQQRYLHFSPGGNVRGEMSEGKCPGEIKVLDPMKILRCCIYIQWLLTVNPRKADEFLIGNALSYNDVRQLNADPGKTICKCAQRPKQCVGINDERRPMPRS